MVNNGKVVGLMFVSLSLFMMISGFFATTIIRRESFVFAPTFFFCIVVLILAKFMKKNRYVAFFLFGKQFNYNVK